jgi:hypothetical protein
MAQDSHRKSMILFNLKRGKKMTANDIKNEFQTMQIIAKKLLNLSDEQRARVINFLLQSVSEESSDAQNEIKTIGFCLSKLEKLGKDESNAVVKFLVDRFMATRCEKSEVETSEPEAETELWEDLEAK